MDYTLYRINRQLDLLAIRANRIGPGPCRDSLVRRMERLNVVHHLILARLASNFGDVNPLQEDDHE